jgi:predicted RNA-binding Zn-ribbon protein involved in translation (DUF1610 family)
MDMADLPARGDRPSAVLFTVVGIAMVLGGGVWTAVSSSVTFPAPWNYISIAAASAFTALGGVAVSWVSASWVARRQAVSELQSRIAAVSQNLSQSTSAVSQALDHAGTGSIPTETALALVEQNAQMITGQITQLQSLVGEKLDAGALLETHQTVISIATRLASLASTGVDAQIVKEELSEISATLTGVGEQLQASETKSTTSALREWSTPSTRVEAVCPNCGHKNLIPLRTKSGSTRGAVCGGCGEKVLVHRVGDGGVKVRLTVDAASSKGEETLLEFSCENCQSVVRRTFDGRDGRESATLLCVGCATAYNITIKTREVQSDGKYATQDGPAVRETGSQPWTPCPTCGTIMRCALKRDDHYFAFCRTDRVLVRVTPEEISMFRSRAS